MNGSDELQFYFWRGSERINFPGVSRNNGVANSGNTILISGCSYERRGDRSVNVVIKCAQVLIAYFVFSH